MTYKNWAIGIITALTLTIPPVQAQITVLKSDTTTIEDALHRPADSLQTMSASHVHFDHGRASYAWKKNASGSGRPSEFIDIKYDNGEVSRNADGSSLFLLLQESYIIATRFAPKTDSGDGREIRIDRIWLAPYFFSQFGNTTLPTPNSAPRDMTVYIYSDKGGEPGDVLFSKVIEDPREFSPVTDLELKFFELNLSNEDIGTLPNVVHIGYGNAGNDENYYVVAPAPYTVKDVSHMYLGRQPGWGPLWQVLVDKKKVFDQTVIPIRARFRLEGEFQFAQTIANQTFPVGEPIVPLILPETTGGTAPINYSLTPILPAGLNFNSSTRTINGTPTQETTAPVQYTYRATDAGGKTADIQFSIEVTSSDGLQFVYIQYDDGEVAQEDDGTGLFIRPSSPYILATRFAPKTASGDTRKVRIDRIWLAPYFQNQFRATSLPNSAPRRLTVYVYSDQEGIPGDLLFSGVIEDPREFFAVTSRTLRFFELDLSSKGIGVLPDVVHIGYGDTGTIANLLVPGLAPYTQGNLSHMYLEHQDLWGRLWDAVREDTGERIWDQTVAPVRARFSVGGEAVRLHFAQNIEDQIFPPAKPIAPFVLPRAREGVPPINYSLTPVLPAGLSFDSLTRTISGTPTAVTLSPVQYTYRAVDSVGDVAELQFKVEVNTPLHTSRDVLPTAFTVHGNYPNPFQQSTSLLFDLPLPSRVVVEIIDLLGRRVLTLPPVDLAAGWENHIKLDGKLIAPGHYLYRMVVYSAEGSLTKTGHLVHFQ